MAKSKDAKGKMDEQLKEKTNLEAEVVKTVLENDKKPEVVKPVLEDDKKPEVVKPVLEKPEEEMLSKPEVDLLARKFADKKKEDKLPLRSTIQEVKDRNQKLQELKKSRKQQPTRIIRDLRQYDPKGKKTCARCAHRVLIETMDSKKELCEICAS